MFEWSVRVDLDDVREDRPVRMTVDAARAPGSVRMGTSALTRRDRECTCVIQDRSRDLFGGGAGRGLAAEASDGECQR